MIKKRNSKGILGQPKTADEKVVKASKVMGLFGFIAITGASIFTLVFYPSMASSGFNTILWLIIGGVLWSIPTAICAAELATVKQWSQLGGLYNWAMMMLNKRWGWVAIFFEWFQITIVLYVFLDFIVSGMFYMAGQGDFFSTAWCLSHGITNTAQINLTLLDHEGIKWAVMLLIVTVLTCLNLGGLKFSIWFSHFSLPCGIVIPGTLLIIFGFWAFSTGHAVGDLVAGWDGGQAIVPQMGSNAMTNVSQFVIFGSFIINYTGIEQTASTIRRMKNPGRDYPIGAMVVCAIMITFGILCSVAIVLTVNINGTVLYKGYQTGFTLNNGIYLAFYHIIIGKNSFGIDNAEAQGTFKFLAFLTLMGAMGQTNAVMIEPSTGVHGAFVDMRFPKFILKVNKLDVHYNILIMQCLLTIMWFTILNFTSLDGDITFTICVNLGTVCYMVAYILLFVSYLKLTALKKNDVFDRVFKLKGGRWTRFTVGLIGLIMTCFTFIILFAPPSDAVTASEVYQYTSVYIPSLVILFAACLAIPFVVYQANFNHLFKKPILKFLKQKGFSDEDAKHIWHLFKKDKNNIKVGAYLAALGMDPQFVNYYANAELPR